MIWINNIKTKLELHDNKIKIEIIIKQEKINKIQKKYIKKKNNKI